ncbi:MAG: UPF0182 family protein [Actinomycetia bacterium]|nr:UPF0182 family protein [Actinomycetes bacterium]
MSNPPWMDRPGNDDDEGIERPDESGQSSKRPGDDHDPMRDLASLFGPFAASGAGGLGGRGGDDDSGGAGGGGGRGGGPRGPRPARGAQGERPRRSPLTITLFALVAIITVITWGAGLWTDYLWYNSVGFAGVFTTMLLTRFGMFLAAFLLVAGLVAGSMLLAYRTRPIYVPTTPAQQVLEQYREAIEPVRRLSMYVVPAILGLLAGSAAGAQWETFLKWRNGTDFGTRDPQFNLDVGFYVFDLPFYRFLLGFATIALVMSLIAAVVTHYIYGGVQLPGRGPSTRTAFIHIGVLGALIALVRAGVYWLDRYALTTREGNLITGITYTDANAVLPTKAILAIAAIMCAAMFLAAIWTRSWRIPVIGVALLTITSIVAGGIYPALVQSLRVTPSERALEAPFIQRNIDATRAAYGIDDVETTPYAAVTDVTAGQLRQDAETIPGIRLVDPNIVSPTFRQFESLRPYYAFPDILDVDRYEIEGEVADAVVAVREINLAGVPGEQRNWVNDHTVYTHGYGFVGAYGNRRTTEGDPVFFSGGLSDDTDAGQFEPRIYFGEISPLYSVVGDTEGADPREFDYPDDEGAGGNVLNTYTGDGGVEVGSFFRKIAYALKYRELNFLLSEFVNSESRILDHRTPVERVERVAPWLTVDGNIYPAVVDGRIKWIVDGYTMTADYPYSRLVDLETATSDSITERANVITAGAGRINYVRNSVKATVDAYDGTVRLYAWDTEDPLLKAWEGAFPGSLTPMSEMSADLMSHVRYPQDLLKIQRVMLSTYHVTDPGSYYTGQDFWAVPNDPTAATQDQPTYYQSLAMPDQESPSFSLTTTFIPTGSGREILRGFLAVDADAGNVAGEPSQSYGTLRLLELPRASAVDGPGQVQNQIEVSTERSQDPSEPLNLSQFIAQNRQTGRQLTFGNLLTLPVGGGLLYIQPVYVQAQRESGAFPQNKATIAVFGKEVAWGTTLNQALDGLFGGDAGASIDDEIVDDPGIDPGEPREGDPVALAQALADIDQAYKDGEEALRNNDFTGYGEAQQRLQEAIARAVAALPSGMPPPTPTDEQEQGVDSAIVDPELDFEADELTDPATEDGS